MTLPALPPSTPHYLMAQRQHLTLMPELDRALWDYFYTRELVMRLMEVETHPVIEIKREAVLQVLRDYGVVE